MSDVLTRPAMLSSSELADLYDITFDQVHRWAEAELLLPTPWVGRAWRWNPVEQRVCKALVFMSLRGRGATKAELRPLAEAVRAHPDVPWFVVNRGLGEVVPCRTAREVVAASDRYTACQILVLGAAA